MKVDITQIKQDNEELKQKLIRTNRTLKKNIVLIFGITEEAQENTKEVMTQFIPDVSATTQNIEIF